MKWRAGSMIGLPDMRPSSFRKAMTEPVKVMAPMATPSASRSAPGRGCRRRCRCRSFPARRWRRPPPCTAARPTSEWKAATSCGIEVMAMRRAMTAPTPPPMARPSTIRPKPPADGRGQRQRGDDGDGHADHAVDVALAAGGRMRQAAQRQDEQDAGDEIEEGSEVGVQRSLLLLLVHGQHALGDEEAAEDVDRDQHQRDEAEAGRQRRRPRCRRPAARRRR